MKIKDYRYDAPAFFRMIIYYYERDEIFKAEDFIYRVFNEIENEAKSKDEK